MKRFGILIITLSLVFLLTTALPVAAKIKSPFQGKWQGIDVDGSTITMTIREENSSVGKVFAINAHDTYTGVWCTSRGAADLQAIGVSSGENSLAVSLVWWCLPPGSGLFPYNSADPNFAGKYFAETTFTYYPLTDSFIDGFGAVFYRSGK